jgi:hypothetical protein
VIVLVGNLFGQFSSYFPVIFSCSPCAAAARRNAFVRSLTDVSTSRRRRSGRAAGW